MSGSNACRANSYGAVAVAAPFPAPPTLASTCPAAPLLVNTPASSPNTRSSSSSSSSRGEAGEGLRTPTTPPTVFAGNVTWLQLVFIGYSIVAAGPFGLEAVVQSVGPFWGALSLVAVPLIYVVPQIVIVTELATMMPSPHGPVLWVERAFGTHVGFFNAALVVLTNLVDAAVYPALFSSYLAMVINPDASFLIKVLLGWGCIFVGTCISLLPARWVGHAVSVLSVAVMAPFVLGCIYGHSHISLSKILERRSIYNGGAYDIGLLLSTLVWLYTGWQALGCMAEEVRSPRDYFLGLPLTLFLGIITYLVPLLVAVCIPVPTALSSDEVWDTGYLAAAFDEVLPGLGVSIAVAGAISNVSLFASCIVCYSRALWGMAERGWAPGFLLRRDARTNAPYASIGLHIVACLALTLLDFDILVRLEAAVAATTYILALVAVAQLRRVEPNTHRPLKLPESKAGAHVLVAVPTFVFVAVFFSSVSSLWIFGTAIGVLLGLALLTFLFRRRISLNTNVGSRGGPVIVAPRSMQAIPAAEPDPNVEVIALLATPQ